MKFCIHLHYGVVTKLSNNDMSAKTVIKFKRSRKSELFLRGQCHKILSLQNMELITSLELQKYFSTELNTFRSFENDVNILRQDFKIFNMNKAQQSLCLSVR